jgi:hypothetical protein
MPCMNTGMRKRQPRGVPDNCRHFPVHYDSSVNRKNTCVVCKSNTFYSCGHKACGPESPVHPECMAVRHPTVGKLAKPAAQLAKRKPGRPPKAARAGRRKEAMDANDDAEEVEEESEGEEDEGDGEMGEGDEPEE